MCRVLLFIASLIFWGPAWSLGKLGHELVCGIAVANMEAPVLAKVNRLAQDAGYSSFMKSCNWADDIKSRRYYDYAKPHHYINFSRSALRVSSNAACKAKGCVLDAIVAYRKILLKQPRSTNEKRLYRNRQRQALLFLSHFIGDIHQPLHVSYDDDVGGNQLSLHYRGKPISLHWLWDDLLLKVYNPWPSSSLLNDAIPAWQKLAWSDTDVSVWANESLALTRRIYRTLPANRQIEQIYIDCYRPRLLQRIQMAGIRLAYTLNTIFAG